MKSLLLVVLVTFSVGCRTVTTARCVSVGPTLSITAEDVNRLSPGENVVLDVRRAVAYSIDNSQGTVDLDRIAIRTADGMTTARRLATQRNLPLKGVFRVGAPATVAGTLSTAGGIKPTALIECSLLACSCSGDVDCNILFSGGKCGDIAFCTTDGETQCFCLKL